MDNDKAGKIELLKGDFAHRLALALAPTIKAGFPSPADDYLRDSLDFNRDLIKNPEATFYGRVSGDSMIEAGICDSDIAVLDRSSTYTHTIGAQWFQNAVQTITAFSGKKKQTLCKDNVHSSCRKTLPSCTIPSSGNKR